jgi:hypothetical protein
LKFVRTNVYTYSEGKLLDRLLQRFRHSQPWQVNIDPAVAQQARKDIQTAFKAGEEVARARFLDRLEAYLMRLAANPLTVLGHPPLGTSDPNVFRYTSDPQAAISVIADLDEPGRELRVTRIKIKVGGSHGHHS